MASAMKFHLQRITTTTATCLISRQNLRQKCSLHNKYNDARSLIGLPFFLHYCPSSLCSSFSLRSRFPLSDPAFYSLFQRRFPPLRSPVTSMSSPPQATQDPPSSQPSSTKTVRVMIKGRVQGVFYRNWTVENATQLGLKGWVRNRRDGSVEALFSGDSHKVQEMEQRCRIGPPDSMVTGLQVFPCNDDPGTGFDRKPTV